MKATKKKIAVFDIDGTIFRNSLLVELHWKMVKAGIIPKSSIAKLDRRYWDWVTREGGYEEYLNEVIGSFDRFAQGQRVEVIRGLAKQVVKAQSSIVYRYTRDLVKKLKKTHTLIAISGSPEVTVAEFVKKWGFAYYVGTQHEIVSGQFGRKLLVPSLNKRAALLAICKKHNLSLKSSVGVGDTESDVGIFELVSQPICFNPTAKLYKIAKRKKWSVVVERKDMIYKL